ncbi:MAG TPA: GAF domain-containing protein, partial [Anaerolineales bacterium]|nr:GAF domain-containing protein [Anaerolineales bacterium]
MRTLLVFTLIPLALMAGSAYLRTRTLLHEQAAAQSANLLVNQLKIIDRDIKQKEEFLQKRVSNTDLAVLIELSLHANPQSSEFREIRQQFIANFQEDAQAFDQIMLVDIKGNVRVASLAEWQGQIINLDTLPTTGSYSIALNGLAPFYENEFILVTSIPYETSRGSVLGAVIGITRGNNLQQLVQPLNGLAPFANSFFILSDNTLISNDPSTGEFMRVDSSDASQSEIAASLSEMMDNKTQTPIALDTTAPNGDPVLAQILWFPGMQSSIVLEINSKDIYNEVNSLLPFTLLLVLGALAATGLALVLGTRRVIKPLQSLSEITRKFADGDWTHRAEVVSDDEVGILATSFNHMADQLGEIYSSLEKKVDERARQLRLAAEVAQSITTIPNLDEMLKKTVELLAKQFGFYQTSIFMVDRGGRYADFKAGYGPASKELAERKYRLEVGSATIIGWVVAKNTSRITSDVLSDPLHLTNELLPETRSEASVPISLGSLVLGVLDVQSTSSGEFGADTVVMLQTLASQIAAAIQTGGLIESSQVNFQELERLYRSSRLVAEAKGEAEILRVSGQILASAPYPIVLFQVKNNILRLISAADSTRDGTAPVGIQAQAQVDNRELDNFLLRESVTVTVSDMNAPKVFRELVYNLDLINAVFIPVRRRNTLAAIIMIGGRQRSFSGAAIQPYANLADLMSISLERAEAVDLTEKHLHEVEALASINDLISSTADIQSFYHALLAKIRQIIGDYNLMVALYDEKNNSITVPFSYENGKVTSIDSFPLGEGLTSFLIRTRQPLLLVENAERKAEALGAKVTGKPAKSWMGTPMLVQNQPIGALILQDLENEHVFDEDDLKFFTTIASQVGGVINSVRLLDESQHKALQLETAAEIAKDISGSLNLDELLSKSVNLIRERFNFYHSAIFLLDIPGEFAVIREATGDAGAQMKRSGHKIGVGSKSIVGFVSGRGDMLVVNDTSKDATYYANPLLPDTRSEAALPLKVSDRILGVLDVQSTRPFA